eukprot:3030621-Lingulodinium_polyedra.AAC.1
MPRGCPEDAPRMPRGCPEDAQKVRRGCLEGGVGMACECRAINCESSEHALVMDSARPGHGLR